MSDPVLAPRNPIRHQQASEQFGAALADAVLTGVAAGLGRTLATRSLSPGPWVLHADGTVYHVTAELLAAAEEGMASLTEFGPQASAERALELVHVLKGGRA